MARISLHFIEPMKAQSVQAAPQEGQWLYEVKFDGFRVLTVKNGKTVELWSRNKKLLNKRFPEIASAVSKLPVTRCILDGEACALDSRGLSSFQLLQRQAEINPPVVYYVFDLLADKTEDLRQLPLLERKNRLKKILPKDIGPLRLSHHFTGKPGKIIEKMRLAGAEGTIAKRADSVYEAGSRSGAWVKIKFHKGQEFVVIGYTSPRKSRTCFGALLLGYYNKGRLIFAGHVGTGFSHKTLKEIHKKLKLLECMEPPIEEARVQSSRWRARGWKPAQTHWVHPVLVAQVQFTEWTEEGILRHPSFQGLREDKNPSEVVRE